MQIGIGKNTVWLNYNHLYYFYMIANEGSIAAASKKLRIGQPSLSAQLKQFEETLQAELFERSHKKMTLNETGRIILNYATEIFKMGSEMVEVIQDKLPTTRTHVQIGALDSVPKHVILEVAKASMKLGNCLVSILEGKSDELMRELKNHTIDLIISNFVPNPAEVSGIYCRKISKSPVVICGAKKFTKLKTGFPGSLENAPFIMPTYHSKLRHDLDHYFKLTGVRVDVISETQDTATQKLMGIEGLGLIPIPLIAAKEYLRQKNLYEIGQIPDVVEEIYLISASRKIENPFSSALIKDFKLTNFSRG